MMEWSAAKKTVILLCSPDGRVGSRGSSVTKAYAGQASGEVYSSNRYCRWSNTSSDCAHGSCSTCQMSMAPLAAVTRES